MPTYHECRHAVRQGWAEWVPGKYEVKLKDGLKVNPTEQAWLDSVGITKDKQAKQPKKDVGG